jgi:hypothetical protein
MKNGDLGEEKLHIADKIGKTASFTMACPIEPALVRMHSCASRASRPGTVI